MTDTRSAGAAAPSNRHSHATGRQKWLGHMAMVLFAALIAGSFSLGGMAAQHIGPAALNALRFVLGASMMGFIVWRATHAIPRWPAAPWRFLILGALMGIYFVTMFIALALTDPVSVGAVFTLNPFFSAVFGWVFLRQVPRPAVLASLAVAGAGALWLIFRGDVNALLALDLGKGELIYLFGVICHSAYAPLVRRFSRGEPLVVSTFWSLAATALCVNLYGWREIGTTDWTHLPAVVWIAIGYVSIFTTAITVFLLQFASMRLPAAKVFGYGYLTPAFIIILEGVLGHGWASAMVMSGALVIVMGLVVLALTPDG